MNDAGRINKKRILRDVGIILNTKEDWYCADLINEDMTKIESYIHAPEDSVYKYTFIKVLVRILPNYPFEPPCVTLTHYNQTGVRIHPNLYDDGKICLSILGTWVGEKWTAAMDIEYIFRIIQSLLDNSPYQHEPRQKDNKEFNDFVSYYSLTYLLIDYLANEPKDKLRNYIYNKTLYNFNKIKELKFDKENVKNVNYTNKIIKVDGNISKKIESLLNNF